MKKHFFAIKAFGFYSFIGFQAFSVHNSNHVLVGYHKLESYSSFFQSGLKFATFSK